MIFEYSATRTFTEVLELNDPGNCAIHGEGSFRDGKITFEGDYYMIIKTIMGKTTFIKWGPLIPDLETLPNTFKLEIKTSPYKEATVAREIQSFINDGFKDIQKAEEILVEEALEFLPQENNYLATIS
jgi:hypothetical protein